VELVQFDLVKEKEFWRIWLLGYLGISIAPFLAHPGSVLVEH
jgi:hypothetical protein